MGDVLSFYLFKGKKQKSAQEIDKEFQDMLEEYNRTTYSIPVEDWTEWASEMNKGTPEVLRDFIRFSPFERKLGKKKWHFEMERDAWADGEWWFRVDFTGREFVLQMGCLVIRVRKYAMDEME